MQFLGSNELQENLCDAECYDAELDRCHGATAPGHGSSLADDMFGENVIPLAKMNGVGRQHQIHPISKTVS